MDEKYLDFPIKTGATGKKFIEISGNRADANFVQEIWNDEHKNTHPRVVADSPVEIGEKLFAIFLV